MMHSFDKTLMDVNRRLEFLQSSPGKEASDEFVYDLDILDFFRDIKAVANSKRNADRLWRISRSYSWQRPFTVGYGRVPGSRTIYKFTIYNDFVTLPDEDELIGGFNISGIQFSEEANKRVASDSDKIDVGPMPLNASAEKIVEFLDSVFHK